MNIRELVRTWFGKWEEGDYLGLPLAEDFRHTSPYGTIEGKEAYLDLVSSNTDKFLNNTFEFHDEFFGENRACVRYTVRQGDFSQDVSEWLYEKNGLLAEIVSYYNIKGEISSDRKLEGMD